MTATPAEAQPRLISAGHRRASFPVPAPPRGRPPGVPAAAGPATALDPVQHPHTAGSKPAPPPGKPPPPARPPAGTALNAVRRSSMP
ncbi:unnamed protein product, partial [Chrysoparadoxa australica]